MLQRTQTRLLDAYHEICAPLTPDGVEQRRAYFMSKYPPDLLPKLASDEIMRLVHGDTPKTGLFYDLEFAEEYAPFGNIGGGSSLKFKVYRAADGSSFKKKGPGKAPIPCSDAEAERMLSLCPA